MAAIKPLDKSAEKWERRASAAGSDYSAGVDNPRKPWADSALKAEGNYKTSVMAAASAGRFGAGIRRVGNEKWQTNSKAKGPTRYAEGVQLAVGEWQRGFTPYQTAYQAITLPERGPRRSEQNYNRSKTVGQTFGAVKDRLAGSQR